jgi:hypothetical protein
VSGRVVAGPALLDREWMEKGLIDVLGYEYLPDSVAPALLCASTTAVNKVGHVIGNAPRWPRGSVIVAPTPFSELPGEMTAEWQITDLTTGTRDYHATVIRHRSKSSK